MKLDKRIKEFLSFCDDNNIELYLVGGATRDYLLNKECFDLDFCLTSDYQDALSIIKKNYKCKYDDKYQSIKFVIEDYSIEISHARKEREYLDYRHPYEIEFTNDIKEDSKRRDFTINAIYYRNGEFYDFYNGISDLKNNKLKVIGNTLTRFKEDPLRILRMIRFSTSSLEISESDKKIIFDNSYLLKELSITSFNKEFDRILNINNVYVINEYKCLFEEYFNVKIKDVLLLNRLVSLDEKKTYLGIKNKSNIYKYKDIVINDNKKELTRLIYKFGKDVIKELVEYYDKVNNKQIINLYNNIISYGFYSKNQLNISSEEIIELIDKKELTSYYIDMIVYAIIDEKLENDKDKIRKYILECKK